MNYFGTCRKFCAVARNSVIKSYTERDNKVRMVHRHRRSIMSVHSLHTEESRVPGGYSRKAHKRATDRCIDFFGKAKHFLLCPGSNKTAAEINIRSFGHIYIFRRFLNTYILCRQRQVRFNRRGRNVFALCRLYVLRYIYEYRSGSARFCKLECFSYCVCKILNRADKIIVLCYGERNARNIYFLEAVGTYLSCRHVAANGD